MSSPDQVLRHYCESCRARYGLPEAIGAPFGGFVTANCEFCRRERECHAVEEWARVRPRSEEALSPAVFDWDIRERYGWFARECLVAKSNAPSAKKDGQP